MGHDKETSEYDELTPEQRAVLEDSDLILRDLLEATDAELAGLQPFMNRRELVGNSLASFQHLRDIGVETTEINESLKILDAEYKRLDAEFAEYRKLSARREALKAASEYNQRLLSASPDLVPREELALWEIARRVLLQEQRSMTAKEILERVTSLGHKVRGRTPAEAVRTALIRKPEVFQRTEDGKFQLMSSDMPLISALELRKESFKLQLNELQEREWEKDDVKSDGTMGLPTKHEEIGHAERKQRDKLRKEHGR
jgi:hypothetical protein